MESLQSVIEDIITEEKSKVFKAQIIMAGFRKTGIWLFDDDLIHSKFNKMYLFNTKPQPHTSQDDEVKQMAEIL